MPDLDQFFTRPEIARRCWKYLLPALRELTGRRAEELCFIEPGAGDGVFYDLFPAAAKRIGLDIAPRRDAFLARDFLEWRYRPKVPRRDVVVVGNPPFGTRGKTAAAFFNRAAEMADTVAFIVPVIFRKYFIHKQLHSDFRWIYQSALPRDSFRTDAKKIYAVNTEFQVWTRIPTARENLRLFSPPPISHRDFIMHQYNNTTDALRVFGEPFDFAVPSQGWQDYARRETDPAKCEKNKQWMLFKPRDRRVYERLYRGMDYAVLAQKNTTSIPGFRKGDIVREYALRYESRA
ncbi:MAG: hypothetical protein ACR2QC_12535 [Gammaproteobacteria bacterium]